MKEDKEEKTLKTSKRDLKFVEVASEWRRRYNYVNLINYFKKGTTGEKHRLAKEKVSCMLASILEEHSIDANSGAILKLCELIDGYYADEYLPLGYAACEDE